MQVVNLGRVDSRQRARQKARLLLAIPFKHNLVMRRDHRLEESDDDASRYHPAVGDRRARGQDVSPCRRGGCSPCEAGSRFAFALQLELPDAKLSARLFRINEPWRSFVVQPETDEAGA